MDIITEILKTVGIPTIIGFIIWLAKLESNNRQTKEKLEFFIAEKEKQNEKNELLLRDINLRIDTHKSITDQKFNEILTRITDSISILTTATAKHDILLGEVRKEIDEISKEIKR